MSAPITDWICRRLSNLLGFDASEDVANYILAIEDIHDLEDYLLELLDGSVPENRSFINQLLKKWTPPKRTVEVPAHAQVYRKSDDVTDYVQQKDKTKTKTPASDTTRHKVMQSSPSQRKKSSPQHEANDQGHMGAKKKGKFVALYSQEGQEKATVRLTGRHVCECQSHKHKLIGNCLRCGRVVCDQEGSGPCFFCGNLVCTREERDVLSRGSKKSEKLYQFLTSSSAVKHKDKLLEFDKSAARRTQVIDDEADYFTTDSNQWLSTEEKKALRQREADLRAKRHASRLDRKVTLDFAGRQVLEDIEVVDMYSHKDEVVQQIYNKKHPEMTSDGMVNPTLSLAPPQFVDQRKHSKHKTSSETSIVDKKSQVRLQDRELLEMSDDGMCLSMHQPWASLLVKGIKIHEGRTWYATHRGRLWIAATSKKPSPEEIVALEDQYTRLYPETELNFPRDYPTSCLLGCVDVTNCLPQEEYNLKFPLGESGSPYVLICENPQELIVKFPMKGKHKIYKLDSSIHQGAKKGLRFAIKN